MSLAATRYSAPSGSTISTHSTISPMARPYAPAFIVSAPPTVPGIPPSSSAPERADRAHRTANLGSITPASATAVPPEAKRTFPMFFLRQTTVPRTPPSDTSRLLPPPSALTSRFAARPHAALGKKCAPQARGGPSPPRRFPGLPCEKGRLVSVVPYCIAEPLARGPRDRLFSRGVHLENEEQVRVMERGDELLEKGMCPGVPVRLEADDDPAAWPHFPGSSECCPDLRRVMPVIVHDRHAFPFSLDLEPPVHPPVVGKPLPDLVEGDPQLRGHRNRRERVARVVAAGRGKRNLSEALPAVDHPEPVCHALGRDPVGPGIRLQGETVGDGRLLQRGDEVLDVRVVRAQDG